MSQCPATAVAEAQQELMRALADGDATSVRAATTALQTAATALARDPERDTETLGALAATQRRLGGMLRARLGQSRDRLDALGLTTERYERGGHLAFPAG